VLASPAPRRLPARIRYGVLGASLILAVGGIYTIAARLPLNRLDHALAKQQWAKAEAEAQQASDLAPWSSEPWLALGEAELTNGLTPQAQAALRTATRKDPNNWVTWWDLARATGDGEREDALLHVAELNPRAPKATGD
jgi:cytochrome c-type biogenesis protein CcmH/NrfG